MNKYSISTDVVEPIEIRFRRNHENETRGILVEVQVGSRTIVLQQH